MSGRFKSEGDWAVARLSAARGRTSAFLSAEEGEAAERLRADHHRGSQMASITQRWDLSPRSGRGRGAEDLSDAALDARARLDRAIEAVGPELSGLLLDICCHLKGLEEVERERLWPARSAKMLLKAGLGILARHYGITGRCARGTGIRRWRDADARPTVSPG
ncbi:hypothetical protein SAMN06297251_11073 [Fulvimarina manganoxydans]|uniref:DUF6456 domain-containing protein n=1 Tax=Fulvimarina manganoxydans TaxID=937218 RepID=A0A1W2CI07_9HYPH|nr:hypothetical protein SAMN06297251_11073 [Fulvimarina manganoxydans]